MRNNNKLVLFFCFLKAVCLVPDLYNYFQSNMDRVLLIMTECDKKHYVDSYKTSACLKLRVFRHVLNKGLLTKPAF